jgi:tryptophanyl-tRNA synthetase
LWLPEKQLRKAIMRIVTNSLEPGEPKDPDDSSLFAIYAAFANEEQRAEMRQAFADGIGWGQAKQQTFELINAELAESRERYEELVAHPARIEEVLVAGARKAREFATPYLARIRAAVGLKKLA